MKVDNNPILEPINEMVQDIFNPDDVSDGKEYEKLSKKEAQALKQKQQSFPQEDEEQEEEEFVIGEPVYMNNSQDAFNYKL